jgi:phenylalanyl-tRNA synthetase alpha chain
LLWDVLSRTFNSLLETLKTPSSSKVRHQELTIEARLHVTDPPLADYPREDPIAEQAMQTMEESAKRLYEGPEKRERRPRDYRKYFADVAKVHSEGAFNSIGYRAPFDEKEALGLCLRTHTTAISSWVLHRESISFLSAKA